MADTYPYDIVIDGQGYLLTRQNGIPAWSIDIVEDSRASRDQLDTSYGQLPPTLRLPNVITSGHSGFGYAMERYPFTYHWAENGDASHPDQFIRGPKVSEITGTQYVGTINGFFEQGGELFVLLGQYCLKIGADDSLTLDKDFGAGMTTAPNPVVWLGAAYVGLKSSGAFWQRSSAGIWTQYTGTGNDRYSWGFAQVEDDLWRITTDNGTTPNVVKSCTTRSNPMSTVTWSAAFNVGDANTAITSISMQGFKVMVGKVDGVYNVDSNGFCPNIMAQLASTLNSRNAQQMTAAGPLLYIPFSRGMFIWDDSQGIMTPAHPGYVTGNQSTVRGTGTAVVIDGAWIYAAFYDEASGNSVICKGRQKGDRDAVPGYMVWHPLVVVENAIIDTMTISSSTGVTRLYYAINSSASANIGYFQLPGGSDQNPVNDSNSLLHNKAVFYFSSSDMGSPASTKTAAYMDLVTENTSATDYVDLWIRVDRGDTWNYVGRVSNPGAQTLVVQAYLSGSQFEVKMEMISDGFIAATEAAIVRKIAIRLVERPPVAVVYNFAVKLADGLLLKNGDTETRSMLNLVKSIQQLCVVSDQVKLIDPLGRVGFGHVKGKVQIVPTAHEDNHAAELVAQINFVVVEGSGNTGAGGTTQDFEDFDDAIWDVSIWDDSGKYGR